VDLVLVGGRSVRAKNGTRTAVAAIAAALLIIFAAAAYADVAPGTDFRVSTSGVDGDTDPGSFNPDVAYNPDDNNYLIVWYGDGDSTFDYEVYGQIVDANGNEIGSDFQISQADPPGDLLHVALDPAVAYNTQTHQYLVLWYSDQLANDRHEYEIWGQVLSRTGAAIGGDFRISNVGNPASPGDGATSRFPLRNPEVSANPVSGEWLAVWAGNNLPTPPSNFQKNEVWAQRVGADTAGGFEVGQDFRISFTGADTVPTRTIEDPVVTTNTQNGEYMVAWYGNPDGSAFEYEIYGQRLDSTATALGGNFRISNVGSDGDGIREPGPDPPGIAYNSVDNQYLVAWYGNNLTSREEYEVWGQRLDGSGNQIPDATDFRISNVGTDGDSKTGAFNPSASYDSTDNQYLVAWYGNTGSEVEICGQKVPGNAASGNEVGGDVRLSNMGAAGDSTREALFPATAWNSQANDFLATWYGDGLATDDEYEVFARRVGTPQSCATPPPGGGGGGGGGGGSTSPPPAGEPPSKVVVLSVNAQSTQKALRAKAITVRVMCDKACTMNASGRLSVPGASKTYRARSVKRSLTANKRVTLKLKLSTKTIRAAKRALKKKKKVRATIDLRATSAAGGSTKSTKRIRITG
jgi:hypothetical protein